MMRQRIANASAGQIVAAVSVVSIALLLVIVAINHFFAERDFQQLQEKRRALAALREAQQPVDAPAGTGSARPPHYVSEIRQTAATNARIEICDFAIRETLRDLKPIPGQVTEIALSDGVWNLRQGVRSADTLLLGAVREVDCQISASGEVISVVKVTR